jgi:glycosyltransferase involved in cell wall biosynthesis
MAVFGGIVRGAGVPLVFWAHDVMTGRHWTERLARRHELDLLVANSAFTLNAAATVYPRASSVAIYAPVDPPVAGPSDARRAVRRSLDTPESAVVIVQASRSEAWKGHLQLVAALAAIRDLPNWIWWQVGGAQRPAERTFLSEVRAAADRAGIGDRVRWLGERTDVPALLAAADLYCQANVRPEPFGVSFVEALAAGVPVVATDAGGAREIIDDSCGVLVAAEPEPIAGALRRLVADDRERARLASGARARAAALCDPERQISALHAALANIADALPRASRGKLTGAAAC